MEPDSQFDQCASGDRSVSTISNQSGLMAQTWDVAVIGAGPAGALVAGLAARKGLRVALLEKEPWPRNKVCGCCLNARGVGILEKAGVLEHLPESEKVTLDRMELRILWGKARFDLPEGLVISRPAMDGALVDWAIAGGVSFFSHTKGKLQGEGRADSEAEKQGFQKKDIPKESTGETALIPNSSTPDHISISWETPQEKGILRSRVAVGSWGLVAPGRELETAWGQDVSPKSRIGAGTTLSGDVSSLPEPGKLWMIAGVGGYVGLVRFADGTIDAAAALDAGFVRQVGGLALATSQIVQSTDKNLAKACAQASWKGTAPLTRKSRFPGSNRFFLLGDAVGYVEPFTGEGMTWALAGARSLADLLPRAVGDWDEGLVAEWARLHNISVGSRSGLCRAFSKLLRYPRLCAGLAGMAGFCPSIATRFAYSLVRD